MKVFISWSGERSRRTALLLKDWLPNVIQIIKPWMSDKDIDGGSIWSGEIIKQLDEHAIGIICLSLENVSAPWILFEAGALMKGLSTNRVCPLLIDLEPSDVKPPLSMCQLVKRPKEDFFKLIETLNGQIEQSLALTADKLRIAFEKFWPDFESGITKIISETETPTKKTQRSNEDFLVEILETVRMLENRARTEQGEREIRNLLVHALTTSPTLNTAPFISGGIRLGSGLGLGGGTPLALYDAEIVRPSGILDRIISDPEAVKAPPKVKKDL